MGQLGHTSGHQMLFFIYQCYIQVSHYAVPLITRRYTTRATYLREHFLPSGVFYSILLPTCCSSKRSPDPVVCLNHTAIYKLDFQQQTFFNYDRYFLLITCCEECSLKTNWQPSNQDPIKVFIRIAPSKKTFSKLLPQFSARDIRRNFQVMSNISSHHFLFQCVYILLKSLGNNSFLIFQKQNQYYC